MDKDNQDKLNRLAKAVKNKPADADSWEALGDLLAEKNEYRRAADCYRRVLALRPDDLEAHVNLDRMVQARSDEVNTGGKNQLDEIIDRFQWQLSIPLSIQILLSVFSFILTLLLAELQQWEVTDLVWSLWISSLVLGFSYLITGIISNAVQGVAFGNRRTINTAEAPIVLVVFGALFLLAFFTVHFGMFHFVHSVFLNSFFPLVGNQMSFPNPLQIVLVSLGRYWPIVLMSAMTQLPNYLRLVQYPDPNFMTMPYKNVVKMHISIFVFAGLSFSQISNLILPYLLILYFFPFGALRMYLKERRQSISTAD